MITDPPNPAPSRNPILNKLKKQWKGESHKNSSS